MTTGAAPGKTRRRTNPEIVTFHTACSLFPQLQGEQLRELADDIKAHGLQHRISVFRDDKGERVIVDGRNRINAMHMAGITIDPKQHYEELPRDTDVYAFVLSANAYRRHLTQEQKRELVANVLNAEPERSNRQVARLTGTDHKTVARVRTTEEGRGAIPHVEAAPDTRGRKQPLVKAKPFKPPKLNPSSPRERGTGTPPKVVVAGDVALDVDMKRYMLAEPHRKANQLLDTWLSLEAHVSRDERAAFATSLHGAILREIDLYREVVGGDSALAGELKGALKQATTERTQQ